MTKRDILRKAIRKALANGWKHEKMSGRHLKTSEDYFSARTITMYRTDFAKALWGEETLYITKHKFVKPNGELSVPDETYPIKMWQYHLQQMVISDDPSKYLEENM